jgi:hypothetical protein
MRYPTVIRLFACVFVSVISAAAASAELPDKTDWKLVSGAVFEGRATGFGQSVLCLQRRQGKLLVNGERVENPASLLLVEALAAKYDVPVGNPKALQSYLARQPFAQVALPFHTLLYVADGREQAVPIILLDAEDAGLLKPSFAAWQALQMEMQLTREEVERTRRQHEQELQNQQAVLQMQAQALRLQRSMEQASWAQAAMMQEAAFAAAVAADAQQRAAQAQEQGAAAETRQAESMEREERRRRLGL